MKLAPLLLELPDDGDPVLTLAEAKAQCRVSHVDDDDYITSLVAGATSYLDGYSGILGRCLVEQSWQISLDRWPAACAVGLPFPDCRDVVVKYSDTLDAEQTIDAAKYQVLEGVLGTMIVFRPSFSAPSLYADRADPIRVSFTSGYGAAEDVPDAIKHAMKLMIAHWYENRETVVVGQSIFVAPLPMAVDALLAPFRRVGV